MAEQSGTKKHPAQTQLTGLAGRIDKSAPFMRAFGAKTVTLIGGRIMALMQIPRFDTTAKLGR